MYKLGRTSLKRLQTADDPLPELFEKALSVSPIDFGIARGKATAEEQFELFKKGRKEIDGNWTIVDLDQVVTFRDGYEKKSNHQSGKAVDVYAYVNGRASWDKVHLSIIAGVVLATAAEMGIKLRWGGTFGSKVFKGWDKPHFELVD